MAGSQGGRFNGINSERSEEFSEGELYPHDMRIGKERGPAGMAQAIGKVVHEGYTPQQAYEVYETVKHA